MTKIIKKLDSTLRLYIEIEKELTNYYNLFKKTNWFKGMTYQEYEKYKKSLSDLRDLQNSILRRLRSRFNIPSIQRYL